MAPRGFDRYMVQIGIGTHPKFAGLTDSEFRAHVVGVLAIAAAAPIRGHLLVGDVPAQPIHVAHVARVTIPVARSAMTKLRRVGVLVHDEEFDCDRVHDWDHVNPPPRNDPTNAERQRRYRERYRALRNAEVTDNVTPLKGRRNAGEVEVEGEAS